MTTRIKTIVLTALLAATSVVAQAAPDEASAAAEHAAEQAAYQDVLEDAERARAGAEAARREATQAAERAQAAARREAELARAYAGEAAGLTEDAERRHAMQREEMERAQEELSRAHRELREATREIAQAHRELARSAHAPRAVREINLGERAVIGVVLGAETPQGVEVAGVSPGGPAERAGLQAGDVLVSIRGESLAAADDAKGPHMGRETIYRVIGEAAPGEALAVVVDRAGETWQFDVTPEQREPTSWQSLIFIPRAAPAPAAPGAPATPGAAGAPPAIIEHIERIELPEFDAEALEDRMQHIAELVQKQKFVFIGPDGERREFDGSFAMPEGFQFDFDFDHYSELAGQALSEANIWFGLPQAQGLELARVNAGLGAYFKTDRGVLVLEARGDNAYGLQPGDVVLGVNEKAVDSPADLIRALREIDPGSEVELAIKRDRKNRTLTVTMPENRLGFAWPRQPWERP